MGDILTVDRVALRRGDREVLRGVSFHAKRGEIVAVMGLSGGGKTTILRCIAGLESYGGSIRVDGGRPGMVFQSHALFEHLSALDNITLAMRHVARKSRADSERRAIELLEALGVAHRRDALPRALSGGEAQRVAIARAMAMDPPLLLLDEPTASLDPARRHELGQTLTKLAAAGQTLVLTTHDDEFALKFAQRVVILAEGSVVEEGPPPEVLLRPKHEATRMLLQQVHDDGPLPAKG